MTSRTTRLPKPPSADEQAIFDLVKLEGRTQSFVATPQRKRGIRPHPHTSPQRKQGIRQQNRP